MVAACRKPDSAAELRELQSSHADRLTLVPLDLTQEDTIQVRGPTLSCRASRRRAGA